MKRVELLITALLLSVVVLAQERQITVADIWKTYTFYPASIDEIRSMEDGQHFTVLSNNNIIKYAYETGEVVGTVLSEDNITGDDGDILKIQDYHFSKGEQKVLISTQQSRIYRHSRKGYFYIYDFSTGILTPLSDKDLGKQRLAEFSPDGTKVAFVRDNNIFIKDMINGQEIAVTTDGEDNKIINGTCDWVYEEEFSFTDGYKWSPEGNYIAYYKFDESEVKEYQLSYWGKLYPFHKKFKYPKAGEGNSIVNIYTYNLATLENTKMDIGEETDQYIPRIKWASGDNGLAILRLNRLQNHLEILLANPDDGMHKLIYNETNKYYIDITDNLYFTENGFVITSEKSGYNHIYYVNFEYEKEVMLTAGDYDVTEIYGLDKENGVVYYCAAESSPINREVYSIDLKGKKKKTLSSKPGNNSAEFSSTFDFFILNWSDANTPGTYSIMNAKGKEIIILESNANLKKMQEEWNFPTIEFSQLVTEDGINLNYWIMKPLDFDPTKEYPVLMHVYGGPGAQTVENIWSYQNIWHRMLVQQGYIVVSVDNRGTGARGEEFKKCTYLELGKLETIDQIAAAKYFAALDFVDENRIGIWGWSYGGYMTTLCMTKGADVFKTGIAVAPVTNWRYYDNIYTERFMRTPQENGENYDINSPIHHVSNLKGNYLLVHGSTDDNVHVQNSYDLITALVKADKQFDLFIYPNKNHGIFGGNTRNHLFNMMTDYVIDNL